MPEANDYLTAAHLWLQRHHDEMVDDLRALVELETPSTDRDRLREGLALVLRLAAERIGEPERRTTFDGGAYGDGVLLDYGGVGGCTTLMCHYDTVWPVGTLAEIPFAVSGDAITGPGVFDMKAGIVQMMWALAAARVLGVPMPPLRVLFTGDEELGSPASRSWIEDTCAGSRAALVFEAAVAGSLKTERKGVGRFSLIAKGTEAHSGMDPDAGVSAIKIISQAILDTYQVAVNCAGTTVNVGTVKGGTRANVIPGAAAAEIDIRIWNEAEAARVSAALAALRPADPRGVLEVVGEWNRPPMPRTKEIARLFGVACAVAKSLNIELGEASVGGGSDGNFAAAIGIPVLDGLGAVGGGAHARSEHASLSAMPDRSAIALGILTQLARGEPGEPQER